jgi:3-phenylpropionate/trans-cinnamate dioxygenase ferredoxin reductase component
MTGEGPIVVVGSGAAGLSVLQNLRTLGYDDEFVLVGAEPHIPYDRPPLSKQVLSGAWDISQTELVSKERLEALKPTLRLGYRATLLDVKAQTLWLSAGGAEERLGFRSLVIATGVRPKRLPEDHFPNVHVLHTADDAVRFRSALRDAKRLVVIGAGFLGLEVAATAAKLSLEVSVISLEPTTPLLAKIGGVAAELLLAEHRAHGVRVFVGVGVAEFVATGREVRQVRLTDGTVLNADLVLVAIGSRPNTGWLRDSGIQSEDGIHCDEFCQAAPSIWAVGDVARWYHRGLGTSLRTEHRSNASDQAVVVAKNILGYREPYTPIPYFWTDHYSHRIQVAGFLPPQAGSEIVSGAVADKAFVQEITVAGGIAGIVAWNSPRELARHRRRLQEALPPNGGKWHLGALADSTVPTCAPQDRSDDVKVESEELWR